MDKQKLFEPSCQGMIPFPRTFQVFEWKDQEWVERHLLQNNGGIANISRKGTKSSFPTCLYHLLESVEHVGYSSIVSFQPHGRSFKIHDRKLFSNQVLPHYFPGQTKSASFLRQLNIYGFHRMIKVGPDQDSYYHPFFLRGRPEMCCLIQRTPIAKTYARQTYDPSTEPDFYNMLPVMVPDPEPNADKMKLFDSNKTVNSDTTNNVGLMMKTDPNQSTSDSKIASKTTINDTKKLAPTQNQYTNWNVTPMPIPDSLPGINTFSPELDLSFQPFFLGKQSEIRGVLHRNPTSYSFLDQGSQSMLKSSVYVSKNMTGNDTVMNCDNPHNIQSLLLGLPDYSSTTGCQSDKIEATHRVANTMPLIETSSVGVAHAQNVQSISEEDSSNSIEILSSIRIFDVNFVHEQQEQQQQRQQQQRQQQQRDRIHTTSQTMNDHDDSSHTSGSRMVRFLEDVDLESD